jgi:hypothetical protein
MLKSTIEVSVHSNSIKRGLSMIRFVFFGNTNSTLRRFNGIILVVLMLQFAPFAHAQPKLPIQVAANCKPIKIGSTTLTVCLDEVTLKACEKNPDSTTCKHGHDKLAITSTSSGQKPTWSHDINFQGTFDGFLQIDDINDHSISYSFENSECTVAVVADHRKGKILYQSPCINSQYCKIKKLPSSKICSVQLTCSDGSAKSKIKVSEVNICRDV